MKDKIATNVSLAGKTTFKVGGTAKYYLEVKNENELIEGVMWATNNSIPIFILGGGSNVIISDKGFEGLVIKFVKGGIKKVNETEKGVTLEVQAGEVWDDLVNYAIKNNLQGIECLSGIPGSVGASPVQNIGAYGQELEQVFKKLKAYDTKASKIIVFKKNDCLFGYRDSVFKRPENKDRYLITSVFISLNKSSKADIKYNSLLNYLKKKNIISPNLAQTRNAVIALRKLKLEDPNSKCNAGSFFKNPIVDTKIFKLLKVKNSAMPFFEQKGGKYKLFAGWLIEKAGWKGKKHKTVAVSSKNALVITNPKGDATSKDIKELSDMIIADIKTKFTVVLEPEVQLVGDNS